MSQPPIDQLPIDQPPMSQPPMSQPPMDQSFSNENYPNSDYLYNKITSQNIVNNIKTYVCAFTINKDIDTHFVKYIVQHKDLYVTFPSFTFEKNDQLSVPGLEPNPAINPEPNLAINSVFNPESNPAIPAINPEPIPAINPEPNPAINPEPNPAINSEPNPAINSVFNPESNPAINSVFNPESNPAINQKVIEQPFQNGGFQDDSSSEENPLDVNFKSKVIEFVKTTIYSGLQFQSEPSYIGYIPNISEQDSVFVFVKIDDAHNKHFMSSSSDEYFESTPNELFNLFKVFYFDVEQQVKDVFTNNQWLYMEQSLASPFSGYLCKLEGTEIKNAGIGEEPGNFNINIDNIGDFFYFSFLPLDPNNARLYQRYALLPMEYDCILDNNNLEYYKQNMILYQNSNSIYFKGEILSNKKEGNQFFAIRSPTQFAPF